MLIGPYSRWWGIVCLVLSLIVSTIACDGLADVSVVGFGFNTAPHPSAPADRPDTFSIGERHIVAWMEISAAEAGHEIDWIWVSPYGRAVSTVLAERIGGSDTGASVWREVFALELAAVPEEERLGEWLILVRVDRAALLFRTFEVVDGVDGPLCPFEEPFLLLAPPGEPREDGVCEILHGDAITCGVVLVNPNDAPMQLNTRLAVGLGADPFQEITFIVLDPTGNCVCPSGSRVFNLAPSDTDVETLLPGEVAVGFVDLGGLYAFEQPGIYVVHAVYSSSLTVDETDVWRGVVVSPPMLVEVVDPS